MKRLFSCMNSFMCSETWGRGEMLFAFIARKWLSSIVNKYVRLQINQWNTFHTGCKDKVFLRCEYIGVLSDPLQLWTICHTQGKGMVFVQGGVFCACQDTSFEKIPFHSGNKKIFFPHCDELKNDSVAFSHWKTSFHINCHLDRWHSKSFHCLVSWKASQKLNKESWFCTFKKLRKGKLLFWVKVSEVAKYLLILF